MLSKGDPPDNQANLEATFHRRLSWASITSKPREVTSKWTIPLGISCEASIMIVQDSVADPGEVSATPHGLNRIYAIAVQPLEGTAFRL